VYNFSSRFSKLNNYSLLFTYLKYVSELRVLKLILKSTINILRKSVFDILTLLQNCYRDQILSRNSFIYFSSKYYKTKTYKKNG